MPGDLSEVTFDTKNNTLTVTASADIAGMQNILRSKVTEELNGYNITGYTIDESASKGPVLVYKFDDKNKLPTTAQQFMISQHLYNMDFTSLAEIQSNTPEPTIKSSDQKKSAAENNVDNTSTKREAVVIKPIAIKTITEIPTSLQQQTIDDKKYPAVKLDIAPNISKADNAADIQDQADDGNHETGYKMFVRFIGPKIRIESNFELPGIDTGKVLSYFIHKEIKNSGVKSANPKISHTDKQCNIECDIISPFYTTHESAWKKSLYALDDNALKKLNHDMEKYESKISKISKTIDKRLSGLTADQRDLYQQKMNQFDADYPSQAPVKNDRIEWQDEAIKESIIARPKNYKATTAALKDSDSNVWDESVKGLSAVLAGDDTKNNGLLEIKKKNQTFIT